MLSWFPAFWRHQKIMLSRLKTSLHMSSHQTSFVTRIPHVAIQSCIWMYDAVWNAVILRLIMHLTWYLQSCFHDLDFNTLDSHMLRMIFVHCSSGKPSSQLTKMTTYLIWLACDHITLTWWENIFEMRVRHIRLSHHIRLRQ